MIQAVEGWVVCQRARRGVWWANRATFSRTRAGAIAEWCRWWRDGRKEWRKRRSAGEARCVRAVVMVDPKDLGGSDD